MKSTTILKNGVIFFFAVKEDGFFHVKALIDSYNTAFDNIYTTTNREHCNDHELAAFIRFMSKMPESM